ncbi:high-affinity nickel-transporter [Caballeronia novacaledonica]|uniref:Nickel/cobalt efflux system n=1 Tax=Caballeronia novacaledonica TaxID=1544861 RepID=A0A2U3I453_9BURK|nr:high-affinity nickel-transporter [Caballeronia novacaledonica]
MTDFSTLLQQGTASAWLFIPSAVLLGALHGLEPGHSKTMMAAFIVAIRGTVGQAVLLGLSATISHTAVVWAVALAGMYFGRNLNPETTEPYFQLASAVLVVLVATWMIWRTRRDQQMAAEHHHHHHEHGDETKRIDTGHGFVRLEIFEDGVPPRFRLFREGHRHGELRPEQVVIETKRPDGTQQVFTFRERDGFLESKEAIPEPHQFTARVQISHERHSHHYDVEYVEHGHHSETTGLDVSSAEYQDAHERAHANDIKRRFANKDVTTGQIIMFGLTGGLPPQYLPDSFASRPSARHGPACWPARRA